MEKEYVFITSSEKISEEVLYSIYQLDSEQFPNPWSKDGFKKFFDDHEFLLVLVFINKTLKGFSLFDNQYVDSFTHLLKIVINNSDRGKKLGHGLLVESMNYLEKLNILKFFLEVEQTNQNAINLYAQNGFKKIHHNKNFYGKDRHAIIMTRDL